MNCSVVCIVHVHRNCLDMAHKVITNKFDETFYLIFAFTFLKVDQLTAFCIDSDSAISMGML